MKMEVSSGPSQSDEENQSPQVDETPSRNTARYMYSPDRFLDGDESKEPCTATALSPLVYGTRSQGEKGECVQTRPMRFSDSFKTDHLALHHTPRGSSRGSRSKEFGNVRKSLPALKSMERVMQQLSTETEDLPLIDFSRCRAVQLPPLEHVERKEYSPLRRCEKSDSLKRCQKSSSLEEMPGFQVRISTPKALSSYVTAPS
ncbi:hypothetical protein CYMTET_10319 [Cymbomonas tetramitiformis]|uniref:Uncharacterized protein n=1 Tax=Cymbomonas tetramitiformis TaxID=36881 RepID=A0AAE0GPK1_9CHLO|nr:hypothetical protein CYMTET_10319 [Cymbomonas tetramitiformis]